LGDGHHFQNQLYRVKKKVTDRQAIGVRFGVVQERMHVAAARAGRPVEAVTLVAVTKTWPAEVVVAAYDVGMRHFGENRPEELAAKRPEVEKVLGSNSGIVWHLIGTLQSRKTHLAAETADIFHALDREKIARRLSNDLEKANRILPCFLEINVSGEATKAGLDCGKWEASATQRAELRKLFIRTAERPGLEMLGLMTMAPWVVAPDVIRTVFQRTRRLAEWMQNELGISTSLALSMGMTDDFEIAIEEGATHIRVGRAIFGERE
jgi:PLP dependent protein